MTSEGETYYVNQAGAVGRYASSDNNTFIHSEQKQNLAEAAQEITNLIKQLEQNYPTATEDEKVTYLNDQISPSFKDRVVGMLKRSGETAIDEFILDSKVLKVAKEAIKGWLQPDS